MIDRDKLFEEYVVSNSHGQTIEELADALDDLQDKEAKLKAVCAELEELQNSQAKVKADAIRWAAKDLCEFRSHLYHTVEFWQLEDYADQVEAGKKPA